MTKQEIFNTVCNGILSQGGPSVNECGNCCYRNENGHKCAAGLLIKDEDYYFTMEGQTCEKGTPVGEYLARNEIDIDFVRDLQLIHDNSYTDHENENDFFSLWNLRMIKIAQLHNLDYSLLQ